MCEICKQEKEDWLFQEVEPEKFICITCGTEIVKKYWDKNGKNKRRNEK